MVEFELTLFRLARQSFILFCWSQSAKVWLLPISLYRAACFENFEGILGFSVLSIICVGARLCKSQQFYGNISKLDNKNSSILDISQRAVFSSKLIHEIKMGGHHARFGAIMVQLYGKGICSLQNASFQCVRALANDTRKYAQ